MTNEPAGNSVFIKLWQDVKHSALNRYFAFVVNGTDVFQLPQLHKHFNVSGKQTVTHHDSSNRKFRKALQRFCPLPKDKE